uniref:Uncharacterized protein n=2 Tax=Caenorhabditis tropicalis TaxID=1561998 RepID=A0A1I7UG86_9PELO
MMDHKENEELLNACTQGILITAFKDVDTYLENNSSSERNVQKDLLLTKVLAEEQKVENNRKLIEKLTKEREELNSEMNKFDLKLLNEVRSERDELQRKRKAENDTISAFQLHNSIDEIRRMAEEIKELRVKIKNASAA